MIDTHTADYCPYCNQPRENEQRYERYGLKLCGYMLHYGDRRERLRPAVAKFLRPLMRSGRASHELLALSATGDVDYSNVRVYARFLREHLASLTDGAVTLQSIHSWGYELVEADDLAVAA